MDRTVILLVDDEKSVLDSLREQLRNLYQRRFAYETAENADEAWEVIGELIDDGATVVVVVSDWLMPGLRGDAFLERVRSSWPHIGRVLLTGQAPADVIARAEGQQLVERVLQKPWSIDELQVAIESAVGST